MPRTLLALSVAALCGAAEPVVVPVGGGSYASEPTAADLAVKENGQPSLATILGSEPLIDAAVQEPTPTNRWWTDLLKADFPRKLWAHPLLVEGDQGNGLRVSQPGPWNKDGSARVMDPPLAVQPLVDGKPVVFNAKSHRVSGWGDWHVRWRQDADGRGWDATLGRGMPYLWLECRGVDLRVPTRNGDILGDGAGRAFTAPITTDTVLVTRAGRRFAVFCHPPATVTPGDGLRFAWKDAAHTVAIAAIPGDAPVATFRAHAFAIPRATVLAWDHQPRDGRVRTTWTITTHQADGGKAQPLQGWLPHQWRDARHQIELLQGHDFPTLLGAVRFGVGSSATFDWDFIGIPPCLPLTASTDAVRVERLAASMRTWLDGVKKQPAKKRLGDDTYWGGKQLTYAAQQMLIARQLGGGHAALAADLRGVLREALDDWFTYTPGEATRYFASYHTRFPRWPGLVGTKVSYGSSTFNDHHFHYGYFTCASALLGAVDQEFLVKYGDLLRLIAKEYANGDRADRRFPFLRCFDAWSGHSYAGGLGSGDGNNQESTSEAMQGWGGLYLLGALLGDAQMTATGAMGYAIEERATAAYWNDYHGWKHGAEASTHGPGYPNPVTGILFDGRRTNGLYWWGPRPIFLYGIQWLPVSPIMQYLGRDPAYVTWLDRELKVRTEAYWPQRRKEIKAPADRPYPGWREDFGGDWGNVYLGFLLQGDAAAVVEELDRAFAAKNDLARHGTVAITYAQALARKDLGQVAWDAWTDCPASTVYRAADGTLTAVIFNPSDQARTVQVSVQGAAAGTVAAGARTLTVAPVRR